MSFKIYGPLFFAGVALAATPACSSDDDGTATGSGGGTSVGGTLLGNVGGGFVGSVGGNSTGGVLTSAGGVLTNAGGALINAGGTVDTGAGGSEPACTSSEAYFPALDAGLASPLAAVYDYGDPGGDAGKSCITLTNPAPDQACAVGSAHLVVDDEYDKYWGAGVGYQLDPDGGALDLSSSTGFSYTISNVPSELRVGVVLDGSDNAFFTTTVAEGANVVLWADLANGEWVDPPEVLDLTIVKDIQFQVPSGSAEVPFDFCVSGLTVDGFIGQGGAGGI